MSLLCFSAEGKIWDKVIYIKAEFLMYTICQTGGKGQKERKYGGSYSLFV